MRKENKSINQKSGFFTVRRIPKKECVCQKLQRSLRYLRVNSAQVAHEGTSSINIRGILE